MILKSYGFDFKNIRNLKDIENIYNQAMFIKSNTIQQDIVRNLHKIIKKKKLLKQEEVKLLLPVKALSKKQIRRERRELSLNKC